MQKEENESVEIKWSKAAVEQLVLPLDFITETGFATYSIKLEDEILSKVENLTKNYNIYPSDKYKKDNDGSYYAFKLMIIVYPTALKILL